MKLVVYFSFAAMCAAQGCYQFSGSGITLQINATTVGAATSEGPGVSLTNFSSTNSLTINGTTQTSAENGVGAVSIEYLVGVTSFDMVVGDWSAQLAGTGNLIPSLTLPSAQNFPPLSQWTGVGNSNFITISSGASSTKYPITSIAACTSTSGSGGTTPPSNTPAITAVEDAGSYTANIAQGSVFVIKGTNLSPSGLTEASFQLPTSDDGVSINFTPSAGGTPIQPYLIYLYNESGVNQLAAILPSGTPTGSYKVTVVNGASTSAPFSATVVAMKPELLTQDTSGSGLVVVQNYVSASELDVNRFTTGVLNGGVSISPAHPGQTEIAWLTGMGPVPGGDNVPSAGYNFAANGVNVQVYVGGVAIPAAYAGRAPGLAGTDQINFVLPANVPTGCTVPFQVDEGGTLSQTTFISIAPDATSTSCVLAGYSPSQLQSLDNGAVVTSGGFPVQQTTNEGPNIPTSIGSYAGGSFTAYSGFEIAGAPAPGGPHPPSGCTVTQIPAAPGTSTATGNGTALDAGIITITGPAGSGLSNTPLPETNSRYSLIFQGQGATVNGNLLPGTYTLQGSGGTGVGQFTATLVVPQLPTVTNMPSLVNRSAPLTLNWNGGDSADEIEVLGQAFVYQTQPSGQLAPVGAEFQCFGTVAPGGMTIPASVLGQLPAVTSAELTNGTGYGALTVIWGMTPPSSTLIVAPLASGGTTSATYFLAGNSLVVAMPYQ